MRSISGITAMLSLRGKIAVRTMVAFGALRRQTSRIASSPRVMFATLSSSPGSDPTLLVPASTTMTFGCTPSSSPFSSRQRMFSMRSAPQPKLPRVPAEEVGSPVGKQVRVVGCAPAPDDRVADEVDVDAAASGLCQQFLVRGHGVGVGSRRRSIGRRLGRDNGLTGLQQAGDDQRHERRRHDCPPSADLASMKLTMSAATASGRSQFGQWPVSS